MRRLLVVAAAILASACAMPTGTAGSSADVRGTWELTADRAAPSATFEGSLVIEAQDGELILGSASWEERDGTGLSVWRAGTVSGRVIETTDVDFDIVIDGVARRHVARLVADTMTGTWVQFSNGARGTFRAVRATP